MSPARLNCSAHVQSLHIIIGRRKHFAVNVRYNARFRYCSKARELSMDEVRELSADSPWTAFERLKCSPWTAQTHSDDKNVTFYKNILSK